MRRLFEDEATDRRFHRGQWRMLGLTIVGYTLFYFMRKNFSFAMPGLEQDLGVTKSMLGNCLMAGGIVYGVSKFLNGFVGDRVNARKFLCFGMAMCVVVNAAFGFAPQIAAWISGRPCEGVDAATVALVLGGLYVLNQFFQGTGFPPCAKLIAFWIPPKELATKMSVWNTSHSIGGGLVAKICGVIMGLGVVGAANQGVGMWRWCFWAMAIAGFAGLAVLWAWLPGTPEEEGLPPVPGTGGAGEEAGATGEKGEAGGAGFAAVFASPAIWLLGLGNFAINAARSLVADWGPTMLQEAKHVSPEESGTIVMLFEFAGIAGMLFAGWATDRLAGGRGPRVCVFMMAAAAASLLAFWFLPAGVASCAAMCAFGFMLYGPQALTGVTATNLCGKRVAGTSIGFISLFSYVGVSVAGKVCGNLAQSSGGWQLPVMVITATAAVGAVLFLCLWRTRASSYTEMEK